MTVRGVRVILSIVLWLIVKRESGGTGRRARLRTVSRKGWGFESPLSHQKFFDLLNFAFLIFFTVKDARAARLTLTAGFKFYED